MLGDDRILRKKERAQPAATQGGQPAATQEGEDGTHCGDAHPTVQERTLCLASSSLSSYLPFNPPPYFPTIRSIMEHYNAGCVFNSESQQWSVPVTHHLDLIDKFHWAKMLDFGDEFPPGKSIVSTVPTFYLDEPDHNHRNKPLLA